MPMQTESPRILVTDAERKRVQASPMVQLAKALMAKAGLSPTDIEGASILSRDAARTQR